jgi:hypothetical protein
MRVRALRAAWRRCRPGLRRSCWPGIRPRWRRSRCGLGGWRRC